VLTIRLSSLYLAHLPLAESYDANTHYQTIDVRFGVFDFSEQHSYGATFDNRWEPMVRQLQGGWRSCTRLAFMQADVGPTVEARLRKYSDDDGGCHLVPHSATQLLF